MIKGTAERLKLLGTFLSFSDIEINNLVNQVTARLNEQRLIRRKGESFLRQLIKVANGSQQENPEALAFSKLLTKHGRISDAYLGDSDEQLLIYIVCNQYRFFKRELNTFSILEKIASVYPFKLVCVEGSEGVTKGGSLKAFPFKDIRENVAFDHLRRNELTGEECFFLASDHVFLLQGVDNLYYREKLKEKNAIAGEINRLRSKIMLKTCLEKMDEMDERVGIFITTNFHKYELTPILREVRKSYVVIEPDTFDNSLERKYKLDSSFTEIKGSFSDDAQGNATDNKLANQKSLDDIFDA